MSESHEYHLPLDPTCYGELSAALGDSPETVISIHHLRRGSCRAYVVGDPAHFDGAIIVAKKLGFTEIGRHRYVIIEQADR